MRRYTVIGAATIEDIAPIGIGSTVANARPGPPRSCAGDACGITHGDSVCCGYLDAGPEETAGGRHLGPGGRRQHGLSGGARQLGGGPCIVPCGAMQLHESCEFMSVELNNFTRRLSFEVKKHECQACCDGDERSAR
jgi:hypothetical protein